MSRNGKYNARKVTIDGIEFDSKRESDRYKELKLMLRAGVISNLDRSVLVGQVIMELVKVFPSFC